MPTLISGRPLLGFYGLFEFDFGDPSTESPMRTIHPSFVGRSMLPFRCPRCEKVAQDLACPFTREHYRDKRPGRDNCWCPSCGCRFRLSTEVTPLPCALPAGAVVGPSRVEHDGKVTWQDMPGVITSTVNAILGVLIGGGGNERSGYAILATLR